MVLQVRHFTTGKGDRNIAPGGNNWSFLMSELLHESCFMPTPNGSHFALLALHRSFCSWILENVLRSVEIVTYALWKSWCRGRRNTTHKYRIGRDTAGEAGPGVRHPSTGARGLRVRAWWRRGHLPLPILAAGAVWTNCHHLHCTVLPHKPAIAALAPLLPCPPIPRLSCHGAFRLLGLWVLVRHVMCSSF
jgi:hypothetical protein